MPKQRVGIADVFGFFPLVKTLAEVKIAVLGEESPPGVAKTPATRADFTTLQQFRARVSLPTWLGKLPVARHATLTNLFNYKQPPVEDGWSVRKTQVCDFRGKRLSYDSHNGTDFAVPPGYDVVAPAPGRVLRISQEFNRGGRKIFLDHGDGLISTLNHLAQSRVQVGQRVKRGEVVGIAGYSGIDAVLGFPLSPPHVHMNTWLNGVYVDPFAREGEVSLWRKRNAPIPARQSELEDDDFVDTEFDMRAVEEMLAQLTHPRLRLDVLSARDESARAANLLFVMNYYPWLFPKRISLYGKTFARAPRLDMPFSHLDFDGVVFADEL